MDEEPWRRMPNKRHKCSYCNKLTPKQGSFVVVYDASTNYVYHFCSWWHFTLWRVGRCIVAGVAKLVR